MVENRWGHVQRFFSGDDRLPSALTLVWAYRWPLLPKTWRIVFRERLGAAGSYYSSPIAADGRIYTASQDGTLVVLAPGDELQVLARNDLAEPVFAAPAVSHGTLYVRSEGHLWAFRHAER